jgi:hypothetical protein
MVGVGLFDQKSAIAATTPIVTALKIRIRHRKNGLLNRWPVNVTFLCFLATVGFCIEGGAVVTSQGAKTIVFACGFERRIKLA